MECVFDEESHIYWLGHQEENEHGDQYFVKDKQLTSVTQLLRKYGISPSYANIDKQVLENKAKKGKFVHKELERYIKLGEVGFSAELGQFQDLCVEEWITPKQSEFLVYNDVVAGTADISGTIGLHTFIGDFKTTASFHKNAVAWQLSLYEYLGGEKFDKLLCFHFTKDGLKLKEVERIPLQDIENLINKEKDENV